MSAKEAWRALRRCWINVFAGAPDVIRHDAGKNFVAKEFRSAAEDLEISVKCVPTEAHSRVETVERNHSTVRTIYNKIKIDLADISRADLLSLAFREINDAPSSVTGISPTKLVFGIAPRIPGCD